METFCIGNYLILFIIIVSYYYHLFHLSPQNVVLHKNIIDYLKMTFAFCKMDLKGVCVGGEGGGFQLTPECVLMSPLLFNMNYCIFNF